MRTAVGDTLLGTEVGSYRVERKIAQGGMGSVYLGVQPAIGSRVAIKVLSDRCASDPALLERFFSEARAVNMIKHESIVNVLDMAKLPDGRPYIVMEHLDGQTLGQIVRRVRAPLGGIARAIDEVLSALAAAHAIGIVHRDLKPDNILITAKGHAKVLDFGIAKLARGVTGEHAPRTYSDAFLGTPAYMSPEQIMNAAAVDARTDIYAMGCVLFEAVTGRPPFAGSTFEIMGAHCSTPPPSPRAERADLPAAFEGLILMALAKDPGARFASASAMASALRSAARELGPDQQASLSPIAEPEPARGIATPAAYSVVEPPPAPSVVRHPTAPAPPKVEPRRTGVVAIVGASIVIAIIAVAVTRSGPRSSSVASDAPADAARAMPARPKDKPNPVVIADPTHFVLEEHLDNIIANVLWEAPEAELYEIQLFPVASDGTVDLTKADPTVPNRIELVVKEERCSIIASITARGAHIERRDGPCTGKTPVRLPRCRIAERWRSSMHRMVDIDILKHAHVKELDAVVDKLKLGSIVRYKLDKGQPTWSLRGGMDFALDEVDDDCEKQ